MLHARMKSVGGALPKARLVIGSVSSFGGGVLGKLASGAKFLTGSEVSGVGKAAVRQEAIAEIHIHWLL